MTQFQSIKRFAQKEISWAGEYSAEAVIYTAHNDKLGVKLEVVKDTEYNEVTATFTVNGEVKHEVFYDKPIRLETVKENLERIYNDYVQALEESVEVTLPEDIFEHYIPVFKDEETAVRLTQAQKLMADLLAVENIKVISPIITQGEITAITEILKASNWVVISECMNILTDKKSVARREYNNSEYALYMCIISKINCVMEQMQVSGEIHAIRMA